MYAVGVFRQQLAVGVCCQIPAHGAPINAACLRWVGSCIVPGTHAYHAYQAPMPIMPIRHQCLSCLCAVMPQTIVCPLGAHTSPTSPTNQPHQPAPPTSPTNQPTEPATTTSLQCLHLQAKRVQPYSLHLVWSGYGLLSKRQRMRDIMRYHDRRSYYTRGNFLTIDIRIPQVGCWQAQPLALAAAPALPIAPLPGSKRICADMLPLHA
jgi:hypothetical protein